MTSSWLEDTKRVLDVNTWSALMGVKIMHTLTSCSLFAPLHV